MAEQANNEFDNHLYDDDSAAFISCWKGKFMYLQKNLHHDPRITCH